MGRSITPLRWSRRARPLVACGLVAAGLLCVGPLAATTVEPATTGPRAVGDPTSESADEPATDPPVADPMANEGGSDGPPTGSPGTAPPSSSPTPATSQPPYRPPGILWSGVTEAERKLERAQEAKRDAVADARALRRRAKHLAIDLDDLDADTRATIDELVQATDRYRKRAVVDYRLFGSGDLPAPAAVHLPGMDPELDRRRGSRLAATGLAVDRADLARLAVLGRQLDGRARSVLSQIEVVDGLLVEAAAAAALADEAIGQARAEYEVFRAGSEIYLDGVVFPVTGHHSAPSDSYGFPRMAGTEDEHWHEGIDLFAPRGTPLVAAEPGVVTRIGAGRLGGLRLWLIGESGTEWYYAHLDSFADGLVDGQVVEAGQLVGYVGNTGNAVGTPPHLHLQVHPAGGRPVNPYPLLRVVWEHERADIAAGQRDEWGYEPVIVARPAPTPAPPVESASESGSG